MFTGPDKSGKISINPGCALEDLVRYLCGFLQRDEKVWFSFNDVSKIIVQRGSDPDRILADYYDIEFGRKPDAVVGPHLKSSSK